MEKSYIPKLKDYTVFDLETTGFSKNCEIIEIAAIKVRNDEIVDTFESFVKPTIEIPYHITKLTGITNVMVQDAPGIDVVLNDFLQFIENDVLIGHNIDNFDMPILLDKAINCYGLIIENNTVDTLTLARQCLNLVHNRLSDICEYYNVSNNDAHRALSDVMATFECFKHMKNGDVPQEHTTEKKKEKPKYIAHFTDETKALQTLQGLLLGVTCDGVLTESEVMAVKQWLDDNMALAGNYPFDVVYSEIEKALEDGVLEPDELKSLLDTFIKLTNPVKSYSSNCCGVDISGIKICLTGEFKHGTRYDVSNLLISLGAEMCDNVTKKVNILIVGDIGSESWKCGNYGGKIKKAVEMQEKGINIKIITESEFYKEVNING